MGLSGAEKFAQKIVGRVAVPQMLPETLGGFDPYFSALFLGKLAHGMHILIHAMMFQQPFPLTCMRRKHLRLGFQCG